MRRFNPGTRAVYGRTFRACALSFRKSLNSSHRPPKASPIRQPLSPAALRCPKTPGLFSLRPPIHPLSSSFPPVPFFSTRLSPASLASLKKIGENLKRLAPGRGFTMVAGESRREGWLTVIGMLIVCEGLTWILPDDQHCYRPSHTVTIPRQIYSHPITANYDPLISPPPPPSAPRFQRFPPDTPVTTC